MFTITRSLASGLALAWLAGFPVDLSAATPITQRFLVLSNDEPVGSIAVTRTRDRLEVEHAVDDNGRGPKLREELRLDARGLPVEWDIEGRGFAGAPVHERYTFRRGRARWQSLNDSGSAAAVLPPLYMANDTSPWSHGLYLRAVLAAPGQTLSALPSGTLRAEKLQDVTVGERDNAVTVGVYALWGLDTAPQLVLLRADGSYFGSIDSTLVVVPEGYEGAFNALAELSLDAHGQYLERLSRQWMHRYDRPIYVRNVRVFDSQRAQLSEPTTVVIFRDRIASIHPDAEPPAQAVLVDGEGGTVLAGLTDMHAHLTPWDGPLHVAAGVTSVRDVGNDNAGLLELTAKIDAGEVIGPRVTRSGLLESRSPYSARDGFVVEQLPEALEKVRWYADHGYRSIKIYNSVRPEWVTPLAAEAHRLGLSVHGHVPAFMSAERAVRDGYDELTHINQLLLGFVIRPAEDTRTPLRLTAIGERLGVLDLASDPVRRLTQLMKERNTALDPTLAIFSTLLQSRPGRVSPDDRSWLSHMPGPIQRQRKAGLLPIEPEQEQPYQAAWNKLLEMLRLLHDERIRILPGTDDMAGVTLHSELEIYARAGIPEAQVLQIATLGCAGYLGTDQLFGSIAPGKQADLILVPGDPTQNLSALRQVRMVIQGGVVMFPEQIYAALSIQPFGRKPTVRGLEIPSVSQAPTRASAR